MARNRETDPPEGQNVGFGVGNGNCRRGNAKCGEERVPILDMKLETELERMEQNQKRYTNLRSKSKVTSTICSHIPSPVTVER